MPKIVSEVFEAFQNCKHTRTELKRTLSCMLRIRIRFLIKRYIPNKIKKVLRSNNPIIPKSRITIISLLRNERVTVNFDAVSGSFRKEIVLE